MVHIGLLANFKHQVLHWDVATIPMKEPSVMLGQTDLTSRKMRKVVIQTKEPVSTREATDRMVKILDINYAKADIEQLAANKTHMNSDERTQLLGLLTYFE